MNWRHLQTILWLRWRLSRNQMGRAGRWNTVFATIGVVCVVTYVVAAVVGGFFGGYAGLAKAPSQAWLLAWDVVVGFFLFFSVLGLVVEIQRSESIDHARLLHLPVSLKDVFLVNYVASHLTLSVVLVVPVMLGLASGLWAARGGRMLLLFPLLLSFVFMISAWSYCLRGWLASHMINPRRRRAIVIGITTTFILVGQLPNLYFSMVRNNAGRRDSSRAEEVEDRKTGSATGAATRGIPPAFLAAHTYVPFLWLPKGAVELERGNLWPAMLGCVGALGIGALGLRRAYLGTLRFYLGLAGAGKVGARPETRPLRRGGTTLLEWKLPAVPEEAAALALASFRSMIRAPEVRMALATSLIMLAVFGTMLFSGAGRPKVDQGKPFLVTGAVMLSVFGMIQLLFNQFGFDRDGFRSLVLLPARRREILLGKNLAFFPIVMGSGLVLLVALKVATGISVAAFLAGDLQLLSAFCLACIAGNLASIVSPYRIAAGSLKATKTSIKTTLMILLFHLLFPVTMIPLLIPPTAEWLCRMLERFPAVPVNLLLSLFLAVGSAIGYWLSLGGLGDLFQRREIKMLQVLTHEVE